MSDIDALLIRLAGDETVKNSVRIEAVLRCGGPMSITGISVSLGIKKSTVSATLYNLKSRSVVRHDKARGLWAAYTEPPIC